MVHATRGPFTRRDLQHRKWKIAISDAQIISGGCSTAMSDWGWSSKCFTMITMILVIDPFERINYLLKFSYDQPWYQPDSTLNQMVSSSKQTKHQNKNLRQHGRQMVFNNITHAMWASRELFQKKCKAPLTTDCWLLKHSTSRWFHL